MAATLKLGDRKWATKEGSLLAYNDENNNYKPLPFDFTRASSATRVNKQGLIEVVGQNTPRIDYTNSSNGVFLLEKAATNTLPYSSDFSQYTKINCTVLSNQGISPDGTLNADLMTATANNASLEDIVGSAGVAVTQSIYVKSANGGNVSGQIDFAGANIVGFIANNEWQRIESTLTNLAVTPRLRVRITNSGGELLVWGAQLETGSYATSYIPTQGSAVTRIVDACSQTPPSGIIGQTEGVMFVDFNFTGGYDTSGIIPIVIGSGTNYAYIFINLSGTLNCDFFDSNVLQARLTTNIGISGRKKIAFAYKQNDFVAYMNGVQIGTDTNGTVGAMGILKVGSYYTGGYSTIGGVNQSQLYNTRLSNAELATLTTI